MEDRVEGRNAVSELLRSGRTPKRLYVLENPRAGDPLDLIVDEARSAGVPIEFLNRARLDRMSERGAHQGVIAVVQPFRYTELSRVLSASDGRRDSLLLALDHVTDPGNLGAVVRTADVVGAEAVIVPKDRAAAMTPSAMKAAAGAAEHMPVCREPNLARALAACKEAGYWVIGASEDAGQTLWEAPLEGRIVIVMGAEGTGLARLTAATCDLLVSIPMTGHVGSLNVSAAAAVLAYEWVRRTRSS